MVGTPKIRTFSISEFNNRKSSFGGFYLTEAISAGKLWYIPEKSEFKGMHDFELMVDQILDGQNVDFNKLEKKAKQYRV